MKFWFLALLMLISTDAFSQAQPGGNTYVPGVSKIVAGTNVTVSPAGGTGTVTVNATAQIHSN